MELARLVSQGRLSEAIGSSTVDVDHAIRTMDFDRAVPETVASLPPDTRVWLQAYIDGVNHYLMNVEDLPQEFKVAGLERQPWTIADLLTISRIGGSDANWSVWITLLKLREREDWPQVWARIVETGSGARSTFDGMEVDEFDSVLGAYRRAGSNALAIAPQRTRTGTALFAADPHVGYLAPTIWLLAGLKSPSYHVVGIMPTGHPFFALGRNPVAAWGGTNLYAASSSFYDVSAVSAEDISVRVEPIRVGSGRTVDVEVRETEYGPIISDIPQLQGFNLPDTALKWVGHLPSDETSAMLAANRATSFEEFRAAFGPYAVSSMNMVYADVNGNIGQIQAARLPRRELDIPDDIVRPPHEVEPYWQSFVDATDLPALHNPPQGYVATANNRPPQGDVPVGIFFSTNDRITRINELFAGWDKIGVEELQALQQDVYMAGSVRLRDVMIAKIDELGLARGASTDERQLLEEVREWDGHYRAESKGALAYELLRRAVIAAKAGEAFGSENLTGLTDVIGDEFSLEAYLEEGNQREVATVLRSAIAMGAEEAKGKADWGSVHRLQLVHPFTAIPLVGDRYRFGDEPIGGSTQTLMKSGHNPGGEDFTPYHGASARFISDLSDLDANYFVLVGGQDGWLNSANFLDQMPLFLAGEYIQLPLRLEKVRARAVETQVLNQGAGAVN